MTMSVDPPQQTRDAGDALLKSGCDGLSLKDAKVLMKHNGVNHWTQKLAKAPKPNLRALRKLVDDDQGPSSPASRM